MFKLILTSVLFFSLCVLPAQARRSAPPLTPLPAPAAISSACDLNASFLALHAFVLDLGQEASDTGYAARHISHTSLRHPYQDIEWKWKDITARVPLGLTTLSDLQVRLDDVNDDNRKIAALQLTASYQDSLKKLLDYTRVALYYERQENFLSMNVKPQYLSFGVNRSAVQVLADNNALQFFDIKLAEARDALRQADLPEQRYARACHISFQTASTRQ